ncbi:MULTISPECIES: hypothetical protein [unclassified Pseudomonas]|uniref:hypothetical protein n=1 Tax=unclassified Pseudomonas TaxID=196821 RepID=UPI000C88DF37|nr:MULTISPECIES: hypothetical protein [unclassified Pseudomonas]PMX15234.1 hypothetical protein C1Y23_29105 [Pseudomonas sp. GW460-12]PMX33735.1 hypothetical protein C1Y24_16165 [Pseudomonas sp. MPR-R2A4]PMX38791.1 hypothetical protein C1Y26_21210 [Pseudomonas sp. MPR-R2A7]PMX53477.1 hypothetical protein C1Y17_13575 [Pseudomonas sp. MPR-R2A6]PMX86615.1 hypothetical protein C1Y21_24335 [Pseudomonas sp. MPR-R2A3]
MHGSEGKDALHSTLEEDPRPKLLPRVLGSLAIVGLMVGLMIGRLTTPDPVELLQVEPAADGVVVWFNSEPKLHGEQVDGTVGLLFDAQGKAAGGQLKVNDKDVNWRIRKTDAGLLLNLVAARPLRGEWSGEKAEGRWRLEIHLQEQ